MIFLCLEPHLDLGYEGNLAPKPDFQSDLPKKIKNCSKICSMRIHRTPRAAQNCREKYSTDKFSRVSKKLKILKFQNFHDLGCPSTHLSPIGDFLPVIIFREAYWKKMESIPKFVPWGSIGPLGLSKTAEKSTVVAVLVKCLRVWILGILVFSHWQPIGIW